MRPFLNTTPSVFRDEEAEAESMKASIDAAGVACCSGDCGQGERPCRTPLLCRIAFTPWFLPVCVALSLLVVAVLWR